MAQEKDKTYSIGIQITGFIELTAEEIRKAIEDDDNKVIADAIKRSFTSDGFASLTPWSIDDINQLLDSDYEFDDFEWNI